MYTRAQALDHSFGSGGSGPTAPQSPIRAAVSPFRAPFVCLAALAALSVRPPAVAAWQETTAAPDSGSLVAPAAPGERGAELRVWLVTAGPGDAVWERYGHNAIRVLDTRTGRDVSYNWGIFDFDQVDFVPRFLRGRMLYMMQPYPTAPMIDLYARANREVVLQELDLAPAEKAELRDLAEINALPENRDYAYQYFLDNCSTRVRDLLDRVLGGRLSEAFAGVDTGTSYRYHTRRLTQVDPLIYTGMDLLLGAPTDRAITLWEEMFLPLTVRDALRDLEITRADGTTRSLVISEEVVAESTRAPEPETPPGWLPVYLLLGLALGGILATGGTARVRSTRALRVVVASAGTLWALLGGVAGTILVLLLFTDHTFAYSNENLFLVNPLLLALAVVLPLSASRQEWRPRARRLAQLLAGIALLGMVWQLVPASHHRNAIFLALLLPAHLGVLYGLRDTPNASPTTPEGFSATPEGSSATPRDHGGAPSP